jgi:hypothetical protein
MKQIFKKGDKVFHYEFGGWGEVITEYKEGASAFPIICSFPSGEASFTWDGRYYKTYPQTLSFTEYTIEGLSQERPEDLPKKGDIVWVRDDKNEEWKIMHFIGFHPTSSYKYRVSKINSYSNTTDYMYMTTTNPYANEQ